MKQRARSLDLIIDAVSAEHDVNAYLGLLKLDGSLVLVGLPEKPMLVNAFSVVANRRSLSGSSIGGIRETQEMLDFCAAHGVQPEIEMIRMDQINEAWERMIKQDVRYRFVIDLGSLA